MSYTAIASQTLASSASSVTFSSIPGTFRDLVLVVSATGSGGAPYIQFNGDGSGSYNSVWMNGNGSSASSSSNSNNSTITTQWGLTSPERLQLTIQVMDYTQTNKHKSLLIRADGYGGTSGQASRWANTSAVTSIVLAGVTFATGSTFSLYGVSA